MDAKRWPPLWVFVGGCLTGAALIGLRSNDGGSTSSSDSRGSEMSESAPPPNDPSDASDPSAATPRRKPVEPTSMTRSARPAVEPGAVPQTDSADVHHAEQAGHSVADVLARLEAEYRERLAPAKEPPPQVSPEADRNVVSEPIAPKLSASAQPEVARTAALSPQAPPALDARLATRPPEPDPTLFAPQNMVPSAASLSERQNDAERRRQQVSLEEVAVLQQATLIQQAALFQYLQLLSLSSSPPKSLPLPPQRRMRNARIVPGFPSSISDTDNPWGFEFTPTVLVR